MAEGTAIQVSDEVIARLDQIAAVLNRPRSWVLEQAVTRFVEDELREVAAVHDALAAYDGGAPVLPHADVLARIEARLAARNGDADRLA
jgi:predicted transcriptional regulator